MFHEMSKLIDVKYHHVRDMVAQGKLEVCKISTHDKSTGMMINQLLLLSLSFARA
jgi:hypothetical protein